MNFYFKLMMCTYRIFKIYVKICYLSSRRVICFLCTFYISVFGVSLTPWLWRGREEQDATHSSFDCSFNRNKALFCYFQVSYIFPAALKSKHTEKVPILKDLHAIKCRKLRWLEETDRRDSTKQETVQNIQSWMSCCSVLYHEVKNPDSTE